MSVQATLFCIRAASEVPKAAMAAPVLYVPLGAYDVRVFLLIDVLLLAAQDFHEACTNMN